MRCTRAHRDGRGDDRGGCRRAECGCDGRERACMARGAELEQRGEGAATQRDDANAHALYLLGTYVGGCTYVVRIWPHTLPLAKSGRARPFLPEQKRGEACGCRRLKIENLNLSARQLDFESTFTTRAAGAACRRDFPRSSSRMTQSSARCCSARPEDDRGRGALQLRRWAGPRARCYDSARAEPGPDRDVCKSCAAWRERSWSERSLGTSPQLSLV